MQHRKELICGELSVWRSTCIGVSVGEGANSKAFRILLVEDSASDIRLVREALKETALPVQLDLARDGEEAINYFRDVERGVSTGPDLVLLDLNLPRKNGREVLAEVKGSSEWKQIPVLVMTSSRSEDDIQQVYNLNANSYIAKPNDLKGYIDVVRAIEEFWFLTATLPDPFSHQRLTTGGGTAHKSLRN